MTKDWEHYFDRFKGKSINSFEGDESCFFRNNVSVFQDLVDKDISTFDIAIIGVSDARNTLNKSCEKAPDKLRSVLYGLSAPSKALKVVDFGNIRGKTINDRYQLLNDVVYELVIHNVFPLIIGGSHDYTLPMARAIKRIKTAYRLGVVDAKIDWGKVLNGYSSANYLDLLCNDDKSQPFDLSIIASQKYHVSQEQFEKIVDFTYDYLRLGEIRQRGIQIVEPWVRDVDIISFDAGAIRQSDMPESFEPRPNGLSSEEACQLMWYAGLSDQLKTFGLFELSTDGEKQEVNIMLGAQLLWHLVDGYCARYDDYPIKNLDNYRQYIVHHDEYEFDIKFYNNPDNDRWWVEVPGANESYIMACDHKDFKLASGNEIPDKWFRFLKKVN